MLIPGMSKPPGFDDKGRFFDTSSMVRLRSPAVHSPDIFFQCLFFIAHYQSSLLQQHEVVWRPLPKADAEGPTLIL